MGTLNIIAFSFIVILVASIKYILVPQLKYRNTLLSYNTADALLKIFEDSKNSAYVKIYNENLIVEVLNRTKLNETQIADLSKEYVKLVFLFSGDQIISDLCMLYGSKETLIAKLTSDFVTQIICDETELYSKKLEESSQTAPEIPDTLGIKSKL